MPKSIPSTLGAVFLGITMAGILTGIVCAQVQIYFRRYQRDNLPTKLMVLVVWSLDILHTTALIASGWMWLIANFGDTDTDYIPLTVPVTVIITAFTTVIVQGFFIARAYRLSGNLLILAPLITLMLLRVGFACATCVKMFVYGKFSIFLETVAWIFTLELATSSVLDILLTCVLMYYLRRLKTGFANLDHIIDKLSLYTLQSGLLPTVAVVMALVLWLAMCDNLVFLALHFIVNKLYAISFLATLIGRDAIRDRFWVSQEILPGSVLPGPDYSHRRSTPLIAEPFDPLKTFATTPSALGDIGIAPLSKAFRFGRFSLDARLPDSDRNVSLYHVA